MDESKILHERARALAREVQPADTEGQTRQVLVFRLAHETYGLDSSSVRQVVRLGTLTALPGTPEFALGIINLHGRVLGVTDLRTFFGLPADPTSDRQRVIVLASAEMEFGVLVDEILGLQTVPERLIQSLPPARANGRPPYAIGVTAERLVLLDARQILLDPLLVVEETEETPVGVHQSPGGLTCSDS